MHFMQAHSQPQVWVSTLYLGIRNTSSFKNKSSGAQPWGRVVIRLLSTCKLNHSHTISTKVKASTKYAGTVRTLQRKSSLYIPLYAFQAFSLTPYISRLLPIVVVVSCLSEYLLLRAFLLSSIQDMRKHGRSLDQTGRKWLPATLT